MAPKKRWQQDYDYDTYTVDTMPSFIESHVKPLPHTSYESNHDGTSLSVTQQYISIESSHSLESHPLHCMEAADSEFVVNSSDPGNKVYDSIPYNWMDPNDIDAIDEPAKRRRTLAV
ncbi:hypothetical protein C0992_003821, partial [Termitomyces sp. T32_za158]